MLEDEPESVSILGVFGIIMLSTLFSIGGGNGQVAVIQDQWVNPGLLAPAMFAWAYALGNFAPGPKVSFIAGIGFFMAGIPGAIAAILGVVIPTSIGASIASHWYSRFESVINHITLSATFVIAGMMITAALGLALPMEIELLELGVVVVAALLFIFFKLDAIYIVSGSAALGTLLWLIG